MMYDSVYDSISKLIPVFGLEDKRDQIIKIYENICRESLALPVGERPPEFSKINEDGIPFQYSLLVGPYVPSLQFLSEIGVPGSSNFERINLSTERINVLAPIFSVEEKQGDIFSLLDEMAPKYDPDLLADYSGTFWIGASFSPATYPTLKIYINGKWGTENKMWKRLDSFVEYFNGTQKWHEIKKFLSLRMKPLGMVLSISRNEPISGRVYISSYGNPLDYYEQLIKSCINGKSYEAFQQFTEIFLADTRKYPTKSVVCSFGFSSHIKKPKIKFELCGHCIFVSDIDAKEKCLRWIRCLRSDPIMYLRMLEVISYNKKHIHKTKNNLHSFIGFGIDQENAYSNIYLKPNLI